MVGRGVCSPRGQEAKWKKCYKNTYRENRSLRPSDAFRTGTTMWAQKRGLCPSLGGGGGGGDGGDGGGGARYELVQSHRAR